MKTSNIIFLIVAILSAGCNDQVANKSLVAGTHVETYSGPIIDMHIHAYAEGVPMFGITHPPTLRGKTYTGAKTAAELKESTIEKFKQYNIVKAVVTSGELWKDVNDDLMLIAGEDKTVEELRLQFESGKLQAIAEMAPFYQGIPADDPTLLQFYELAEKLNIPVGFHIFPGGPNYGLHTFPKMLSGMRVKNASPLQLENVLVKFPKLKLYVMHGGWPYLEDMKALMYAHPNLYVDIAVVNWILPQAELNNYLRTLIDAGFGERILFGTDQMVWPETIDDAVQSVNAAEFLTMKQKEDIFYNNAAKFLGLNKTEIAKHKSSQRK
jgi:uncharacterized protein